MSLRSYSSTDLRRDCITAIGLILLSKLSWSLRHTPDIDIAGFLIFLVFLTSGLIGAFVLARAYYEGTTLIYTTIGERFRQILQVGTVALAWLFVYLFFGNEASISRLEFTGRGVLAYAAMAVFLAWLARTMTLVAPPSHECVPTCW